MEKELKEKIIFITLLAISDISDRNMYADLMRYFVNKGHHVTIISPIERRHKIGNYIKIEKDYTIVRFKIPNIQKANKLEKGVATFAMDYLVSRVIKKHLKNQHFDLAIYCTPPITLVNTLTMLKKSLGLKTYLLLKDIFPQNAVDIGMLSKSSFMYKYFRKKEKLLYQLSDKIGCMSQANVDYVLEHNQEIDKKRVEICPNSVEVNLQSKQLTQTSVTRASLGIPSSARVFIYGGNLGKPQGIDFLIQVMEKQKNNAKAYFIILGSGTEFGKLDKWVKTSKPKNVSLSSSLPKEEYDQIVNLADIGLICLDSRFTIPNYPSRLLAYLLGKKPVLSFTDENSDIGRNSEIRGYGKWSPSNNKEMAIETINTFCNYSDSEIQEMGEKGFEFLNKNYTVKNTYDIIVNSI